MRPNIVRNMEDIIKDETTSKDSQQNFTRQGYMLSFEGGTLLAIEMVTMLRTRDVIHRELASF